MDEKTTDVLLIIVVVVLLVFTAVWIALLAVFCFLKRQKGFSIFSRLVKHKHHGNDVEIIWKRIAWYIPLV